jgi:hypothetical protein
MYCLANDVVAEWLLAMLSSVRTVEPDLEILIIPFDGHIKHIRKIADRFRCSIYDAPELDRLDEIGKDFYPSNPIAAHTFRKFAMFSGPLDRFIFLDADVVVFSPLRPLLELGTNHEIVYFDTDFDQVYRAGVWRDALEANGARGFNTGSLISSRGILDLDIFVRFAEESRTLRDQFVTHTMEQPFLNYCADALKLDLARADELDPRLGPTYAAYPVRVGDTGWTIDGKPTPFIHWAGIGLSPLMPNAAVYTRFRRVAAEGMKERIAFEWKWLSFRWRDYVASLRRFATGFIHRLGLR